MLVRAHNPIHEAILQAAVQGDLECLRKQPRVELLHESICISGCTVLHWAAGMNQVHIVRYLLTLSPSLESSSSQLKSRDDGTTTKINSFHVDVAIANKYSAAGRTPLHYAARNGCLEVARCLIEEFHANPNAAAKRGVTPLHLAFFQNQQCIAEYLLQILRPFLGVNVMDTLDNVVDLFQTNDYGCNVLHWLAICPASRSGPNGGEHLIPTAKWLFEIQLQTLRSRSRMNNRHENEDSVRNKNAELLDLFHSKQNQGHTVLHKAAWLGHYALIRYLHEHHDIWDDAPDNSGNFAVTLAEMANHKDDDKTVNYLRMYCSRSAANSCFILGLQCVDDANNPSVVRRAYHRMAMKYHPDRQMQKERLRLNPKYHAEGKSGSDGAEMGDAPITFDALYKAYHHLMFEMGRGQQCNPAHKLHLLLHPLSNESSGATSPIVSSDIDRRSVDDDCFKARLIVVLKEYGTKGLDISNLKKKWKQVWQMDFPSTGRVSLAQWIQHYAGDVVEVRVVNHCHRAYVSFS
jgi:ankyrin repeat protein